MGAEGFQRAIGKPFGRARRRETSCIWKNAYITYKNDEANYFVSSLTGASAGPSLSKKWRRHFFEEAPSANQRSSEGVRN